MNLGKINSALRELAAIPCDSHLSQTRQAYLRGWWRLIADYRDSISSPAKLAPHATSTRPAAPADTKSDHGLTPRELEVLRLITGGDRNKLIACALGLSPHTVRRHVAHILDKRQLESRGQAAAWHRENAD